MLAAGPSTSMAQTHAKPRQAQGVPALRRSPADRSEPPCADYASGSSTAGSGTYLRIYLPT